MNLFKTLRQNLIHRQHAQKTRLIETYQMLVLSIADDQPIDDSKVLELLEAAGKDVDGLEADVVLLKQRRIWVVQMKEGPAAQKEIDRISHEMNVAENQLNELIQQHRQKMTQLSSPLLALQSKVADADQAQNRLKETCSYPVIVDEIKAIQKQRMDFYSELRNLEDELWCYSGRGCVHDAPMQTLAAKIRDALYMIMGDPTAITRHISDVLGGELRGIDPLTIDNYGYWFSPDDPFLAVSIAARAASLRNPDAKKKFDKTLANYRQQYEREFMPAVRRWVELLRQDRDTSLRLEQLWEASLAA